jgi:hypothetical protein
VSTFTVTDLARQPDDELRTLVVCDRALRDELRAIATEQGVNGAVLVHGTHAVGYHAASPRCSGHLVARVHARP